MSICKSCGNPLIVTASLNRCVFCGQKPRAFQQKTTVLTRRGVQRVARRKLKKAANESTSLTWQQAEMVACDWMKKHGYRDAHLTKSGSDGGVDVNSRRAIAQVKHHLKPVGLAEIQRMCGIAHSQKKEALFFSSAGFTPAAKAWAADNKVKCFRFPPVTRVALK